MVAHNYQAKEKRKLLTWIRNISRSTFVASNFIACINTSKGIVWAPTYSPRNKIEKCVDHEAIEDNECEQVRDALSLSCMDEYFPFKGKLLMLINKTSYIRHFQIIFAPKRIFPNEVLQYASWVLLNLWQRYAHL